MSGDIIVMRVHVILVQRSVEVYYSSDLLILQ